MRPLSRTKRAFMPFEKPVSGDVIAGVSVALVLIPQSLAYAELAGLPPYVGLYAAALPPLLAALFASSPFLQTGPVALTSLLTLGVLSSLAAPGSPSFVALAALLALVVGVVRVVVGLLRLGSIAYFMSQPVMTGFTSAAALLILASQLPAALGVSPPDGHLLAEVGWTLLHPAAWDVTALTLTGLTLVLVLGGRRLSPLFPGVLVAVVAGVGLSLLWNYRGPVVGEAPSVFPVPSLALPWAALPDLLLGGVVIALIGFAEAASIARLYAVQRRMRWNPNREFVSQGVANLTSGLFGGFPVGGSFSRSSVGVLAGAKTRLSGAVTGLTVLAALPLTFLLAPLPKAVLGAVVIAAVLNLVQFRSLLKLRRYARSQAGVGWATFALTLLLAPRIDVAVLIGIGLAIAVHLWREMRLNVTQHAEAGVLSVELEGVLWFGSVPTCEEVFRQQLPPPEGVHTLSVKAHGLGRLDVSGAMVLARALQDARAYGLKTDVQGLQPHMQRVLERVRRGSVT